MKADLTRNTSNPLKHFTRVLMQQGRVQLDADWNEQTAVLLHYLRALAADLIGPDGGPDDSFVVKTFAAAPSPPDFIIGAGHYYVDGILCEADSTRIPITGFPEPNKVKVLFWPQDDLAFRKDQYVEVSDAVNLPSAPSLPPVQAEITDLDPANRTLTLDTDVKTSFSSATQPRVRHLITYLTQPDYPVPVGEQLDQLKKDKYLVYLDVWERLVTYVEDDSIREVALDGPDTAARSKVVWQVKITGPQADCLTGQALNELFQKANRGWLKAMANQASTSADPCIVSPDARYRGAENQLYRVEIHRPGLGWNGTGVPPANAATFKWSRENGSAIFPIVTLASGGGTTTVTLENLGRDDRFGLAEPERDCVEIVDDDYVLRNSAENLLQVQSVDRDNMMVTLSGSHPSNVGKDAAKHPHLRRWDHKAGDPDEGRLQLGSDGAALIVEGANWLELEDGVQIQFQQADKEPQNKYRTGDYWLIPARTATRDVEWLREKDSQGNPVPIAKSPDGIIHHYAPLAVISVDNNGTISKVDNSCGNSVSLTVKQRRNP